MDAGAYRENKIALFDYCIIPPSLKSLLLAIHKRKQLISICQEFTCHDVGDSVNNPIKNKQIEDTAPAKINPEKWLRTNR